MADQADGRVPGVLDMYPRKKQPVQGVQIVDRGTKIPSVQLNSLPTYRPALLSERLEQATVKSASGHLSHCHDFFSSFFK